MDAEQMLGSLIRGALTGRRRRHRGALDFLVGSGGFINASTLMTAAGLAWGLVEAAGARGAAPGASNQSPVPADPRPPGTTSATPPQGMLRLVRLTISAARADGELSLEERGLILERARQAGLEEVVTREIQSPHTLDEILAGATDKGLREDMYTLAFAVVRADEAVGGAERIYLAQLAAKLGLGPEETNRLEHAATVRIDAKV